MEKNRTEQQNISNANNDAENLAREIMELTRNTLLVKLRFLEPAILALGLDTDPETTYMTDGWSVYYGFLHVLRSYRIQKELVFHDYLHMVLHLLFHHPFVGENIDPLRWDLACDIAVESVIDELDLPEAECMRSDQQRRVCEQFRSYIPVLTAESIYHYLGDYDMDITQLNALHELVQADEHDLWYRHSKSQQSEDSVPDDQTDTDSEDNENSSGESGASDQKQDSESDAAGGGSEGDINEEELRQQPDAAQAEADRQWKDISARVQTDLETESRRWAEKAGSLLRNIRELIHEKQSYREFLEQFMTLGEVMKVNDAEFDYVYYTYGLQLYGNTPLVEPLEYLDEKRIRELAIVIDTSASVDGEMVRKFLSRTLSILKDTDSFFRETHLRIVLCDAEVQGDYSICSEDDIDPVMEQISLRGFGGTDFRPAFRYIDGLIDSGELDDLGGVLYFTDGYGIFPEWQPQYDTAFVFIDDPASGFDFDSADLPPWAMRIVLSD